MLASLAVDYVYSNLAIISDAADVAQFIRPDYSKRPEDVFIEVAKYLYPREGATILGFCGIDLQSTLKLPSWAPDFSCMRPGRYMLWQGNRGADKAAYWLYTTSGGDHSFSREIVDLKLLIGGTVVDFVDDAGISNLFPESVGLVNRDFTTKWLTTYNIFLKAVTGCKSYHARRRVLEGSNRRSRMDGQ